MKKRCLFFLSFLVLASCSEKVPQLGKASVEQVPSKWRRHFPGCLPDSKNNNTEHMKRIGFLLLPVSLLLAGCTTGVKVEEWVSSTESQKWTLHDAKAEVLAETSANTIVVDVTRTDQTMKGFGTCFNEQGWASLSTVPEPQREEIFRELFTDAGANLTANRMPVASNDFSLKYYSYDDVDGDFALEHFSIENDRATLIPFIKEAQKVRPDLTIWASPWCPPAWMKINKHYACASTAGIAERFAKLRRRMEETGFGKDKPRPGGGFRMEPVDNGLAPSASIREGEDGFVLEEKYLDAYARYFGKFIDAYRDEGIDIWMVMPQNEFNSAQPYPACTWTAKGLDEFLRYLVPEMEKRGVEVYFGTMERANRSLADTSLLDPEVGPRLGGVGFQWAGKDALPLIRADHPELTYIQSEQECGNGENSWSAALHAWDLMKHYLGNGCSIYDYWNTSLFLGKAGVWGWHQNSLVTVEEGTGIYSYTPDFYVLKHASHYVKPGSRRIVTGGTYGNTLAFLNPDGSIVVLAGNQTDDPVTVTIQLGKKILTVTLPTQSVNTVLISG